ncbi:hypothetical protein ZHAS_00011248 [Anopheles sinensis]|uniref:Uncharacterized protein n=1 Tax=Anopheles sinensis TaxID=74873 RepID=A0A084VZP8_ANOSI|nr:hypothetical protein ZHAS_00011248 [Anopheles sinensis]
MNDRHEEQKTNQQKRVVFCRTRSLYRWKQERAGSSQAKDQAPVPVERFFIHWRPQTETPAPQTYPAPSSRATKSIKRRTDLLVSLSSTPLGSQTAPVVFDWFRSATAPLHAEIAKLAFMFDLPTRVRLGEAKRERVLANENRE